jgi:serine protease inhibitor
MHAMRAKVGKTRVSANTPRRLRTVRALSVVTAVLVVVLVGLVVWPMLSPDHAFLETIAVAGPPALGDPDASPSPELATAINEFGFDLLREITASGDNTFISPLSIADALTMTYNGADGDTAQEMAAALHIDSMSKTEVNTAWGDLLASLMESDDASLTVANSLWADKGESFRDDFLGTNRDHFGAEIRSLDLQAPDAVDIINEWISSRTMGRIPKMLKPADIEASALCLVNTVHFLGGWAEPFNVEATQDQEFTLADGSRIQLPMMRQSGDFAYTETDDLQLVRIPYGTKGVSESRFSAYVMLPRGNLTPADLLADMSAQEWASMTAGGRGSALAHGSIEIPRFELKPESSFDLIPPLQSLGIHAAFGPGADFSPMGPKGLNIGTATHRTYLRVDEEGTEAAAATVISMTRGGFMVIEQPFEFRADRPFIFSIVDDTSGALLFLGVISDPS